MKTYLWIILCMASVCLPAYNQSGVSNIQYVAEITDPSGRALDTNLAVGSITGAADVSPMGGAVYNIPITLPEGVGGMTPQLAVTYNSHGRNGVMGIGWCLSGLSAIARTGRTVYHDGVAGAMDFQYDSNNDRLMLDGQRLIATEGGPGLTATKYQAETESYLTIERTGSRADRYFVATTKDGRTVEYGKTADARMETSVGYNERVVAWCCNYVTDKYGNFIKYTYQKDVSKGEQYIQKIEYGHSGGTICSIVFGYEKRGDRRRMSTGQINQALMQTVLLKQITIYVQEQCVGKYTFNYALKDGISKLVELHRENGNGDRLNSTFCTWTGAVADLDATYTNTCLLETGKEYLTGDFDGDGITDLLEVPRDNNQWTLYKRTYNDFQLCRDSRTINFTLLPEDWGSGGGTVESQLLNYCFSWNNNRHAEVLRILNKAYAYSIGDFNGDGLTELAVMTCKYQLNSSICAYLSGQSNSFDPKVFPITGYTLAIYNFSGGYPDQIFRKELPSNIIKLVKYAIDFNHDGKADIILDNKIYQYNGSADSLDEIGTTDGYFYFENALWADFNGDGRLDFVESGRNIYIQNANDYNFTKDKYNGSLSGELLGIIDINGDGYSRLLIKESVRDKGERFVNDENGDYVWDWKTKQYVYCPPYYNNDPNYNPFYPLTPGGEDRYRRENYDNGYRLYLCNPFESSSAYLDTYFTTDTPAPAIIADIDGDGTPDIMLCRQDGTNVYVDQILYHFRAKDDNAGYTHLTKKRTFSVGTPITGDFNGDGLIELATSSGSYYKFATGNPGQLLASVTNGYNQKTLFEYAPLTTGIYSKGSGTWPVPNLTGPVYVLKTIRQDNGLAAQTTINYTYGGGKVHLYGKGFLGFTSIKADNTTLSTVVQVNNTFDLVRGVLSKSVTTTTRGGKTAETTNTFTIADVDAATKRFRMYLSERKEKDIDGNMVTATYTVDANGNTTRELTDYGGGLTTTVNYSGHTTMGYPQTVATVQKHPDDNASFTHTTTYLYNDQGKVKEKTENSGTPKALTTKYTYDAYGNPETSTLSYSYNGVTKNTVEKYVYDDTKLFVKEHHMTVGSVTEKTVTVPDIMGRTTEQTDANGQTIKYEYDNWGRLKITKYPGNLTETNTISWAPTRDGYYTVSQATGKADVRVDYDLAGREKASSTKGIGNMDITTANTYNTLGQLTGTVSVTGDLSQTTTYEYNTDGRLKKEITGNNITEYIYHAGRETEVKYNGKSTKKKTDGWGNVSETTDQMGNKVAYTYYSSGLPKNISAAGANYGMGYDATGNQTKLADPNAGAIRYTYDILGRPETQTDAKGYVRKTEYDDWGRVAKVTLRDTITQYTYLTSGNGKGQLQKVAELAGSTERHSIAWEYDALGRPLNETRKVAGVTGDLVTSYTYDSNGNIATVTYPGSVTETRGYDSYSNLTSVKAGGTTVWSFTSTNGLSTQCQLGNMSTETLYDSNGQLTALKSNSGNVRNFTYTFDPATGNLSQRTVMNGTESFTYDDLSRLKTAGAMNITYLANGNIDTKTGLGKYGYGENGAGPHAVSSIVNPSGLVSDQVQQISYTAFHKAKTITETKDGKDYRLDIDYGPDQQRVKTELKENGNVIKTVIFAGNYERVTQGSVTRHLYYIAGGEGLCAIVVKQDGQTNPTYYYVHPDHLGSLAIITDADGNVKQKSTYDAWGNRKLVQCSLIFDRGYTGHEHLEEFALVNMNGRMYDPALGRFLSPDPYVQNPLYSQSFNRYAYCLNNPLIYTDPSGEFLDLALFIVGAGILKAIFDGQKSDGNWSWKDAGRGFVQGMALAGTMVGSVYLSALPGMLGTTGFFPSLLMYGSTTFTSSAMTSGVMSWNMTGSFDVNWKSAAIMGGISGLMGGIGGYMDAKAKGLNPWTGKGTGSHDLVSGTRPEAGGKYFQNDDDVAKHLKNNNINLKDMRVEYVSVTEDPAIYKIKRYRGADGILYDSFRDPKNGVIGFFSDGWRSYSKIWMSPHATLSGFNGALNHEFIHAFHYMVRRGIYKNYSENIAYAYSYSIGQVPLSRVLDYGNSVPGLYPGLNIPLKLLPVDVPFFYRFW